MHPFEQLIYDRFAQSIAAWDTERHRDINAISILCDSTAFGQDAAGEGYILQGQVRLSFNTVSYYHTQIEEAESAVEAFWNFAYWPQDTTAAVPRDALIDGTPPAEELALRNDWCTSLDILPEDEDGSGRAVYDEALLNMALHSVCQEVAQTLHQNGIVVGKLGRSVPILIQDLDGSEGTVAATLAANPPGLSAEIDAMR